MARQPKRLPFAPFLRSIVRWPFRRLRAAPRPVRGLAIGVLCALLVQGLFALGWLRGMERGTLDALFRLRGPHFGAPQIVLVMADDATIARYEQWPLPRRVHADLVRALKKSGAKTIAYDLLFATGSSSKADDEDFARACREAGNVVQACAFELAQERSTPLPAADKDSDSAPDSRFALDGKLQNNPDSKIPAASWMSAPQPLLMQAAPLVGHINIHPEKDGVLRRIPHVLSYKGKLYPSLALAAAAHYLDLKPAQIRVQNSEVSLSDSRLGVREFPLDSGGETWVNWSGGYRTFATYSMAQVLSGQVPPEVFKDRIVLVGAIAQGTFEWRATPFSPAQPAVELQANALDNILLQRPLLIAPGSTRFILALLLATITGALIAPRRGWGATFLLLGIFLLMWLSALFCFARFNLYLPFAPAILASLLTYSLVTALNFREEWQDNWRADASVAALARGGSMMMAGHNRARMEKVIRSTAREALQAQHVYLLLDSTSNQIENPSDERAETLQEIAQAVAQHSRALFHPQPNRAQARDFLKSHGGPKSKASWVAAPIATASLEPNSTQFTNQNAEKNNNRAHRTQRGILIAIGQREGRAFSSRDAAIMETLAEQAALALESLEYYELLQSRVDLANSDLREAYGVLSSQSARFMAAVESMDDAFLICDAAHHVVFVNAAAQGVLREATPQLGDILPQVFADKNLPQAASLFNDLENSYDSLKREYSVGERVLAFQLTPLAEAQNSARTGAMLMVSDVSSQRELDRMKTDFVGFVAHELRSPLGVIMGYASLLQQNTLQTQDDDPAASLQAEVTSSIERQCRRLNRMVNDLLDIARLEAGHALDLRLADVDLVALSKRVIASQRAAISQPNLTLSLQSSAPQISLFCDPDRIEQILVNLLSNAAKYSPDGGAILLSIDEMPNQEAPDAVQLRIKDSGMGMTREQTENLFQKFYRTPEAKARGIKGTGLGLFLVRQLIQSHGGNIAVESEPEKGSTFCVTLPRRAVS